MLESESTRPLDRCTTDGPKASLGGQAMDGRSQAPKTMDRATRINNPLTKKILLIGWDAADWEHITPLMEEGLMPTLEGMVNEGMKGNLATLQPVLSPMLWNSVVTGKLADKHGIHGFIEPDPVNGGARPYTSFSRKCKALWNIFTQQGLRSNVVSWWASHPAEPINGCIVSNHFNGTRFDIQRGWHMAPGTVYPESKAAFLSQMKVLPSELTHEHILPFIPEGIRIDQEKDARLQSFGKVLSDCASIHAVATTLMETEPWDFMAVYYDAIDHFCHAFMQYHPPKMEKIDDEDFLIYRDVIRGAYRFHDMMLERLLQLAGDDCTVILCSDHGFQSRHLRPRGIPREPAGPAACHRDMGIFLAKGPGIKKDELIFGASLIDITPTILTLFGLPIGDDMDGRPLLEAFDQSVDIDVIPSWEDIPGDCGMHPPGSDLEKQQSEALMQQFVALGYVEDTGNDKEQAAENADIEAKYNLARQYLWSHRPEPALELFLELVQRRPWESRFLQALIRALTEAGYLRQAESLIEDAYPETANCPAVVLLQKGQIQFALKNFEQGLDYVLAAEAANPETPNLFVQMGNIHQHLKRYDDAERAYRKAIALDDESAAAHQGLSSIYLRTHRDQEAAEEALRAVGLLHRLPMAHFNLGVAMARLGWPERAEQAFLTTLRIRPHAIHAHRMLAAIYRQELDRPDAALFHRERARLLQQTWRQQRTEKDERRHRKFDLPPIPNPAERLAILDRERPLPKTPTPSGKTFVLISGLPRSGTSLMMQMLAAGGLEPKTDAQRAADEDNPQGYYEWEAIKQVQKEPELFDEEDLENKAIKVISMLLRALPAQHDYKVIFMTRPIEEIAASQSKMIERRGTEGAQLENAQLQRQLTQHRNQTIHWLQNTSNFDVIEVDYPCLIQNPADPIAKVVDFLGADRLPHADAMARVIRPELHRQRV